MREIKFRAFIKDPDEPVMFYPGDNEDVEYSMYADGSGGFGVVFDLDKWLDTEMYEVMQFTNQKDRTGKDVYEGDILDSQTTKYKVFWNKHHLQWYVTRIGTNSYHYQEHPLVGASKFSMVVIGNIHENPELLKKQN